MMSVYRRTSLLSVVEALLGCSQLYSLGLSRPTDRVTADAGG
jgi:hypothetical protein